MQQVEQEVFSVDVVDIALVGVSPLSRPRVRNYEPIARILKARLAFDDHGPINHYRVLAAKVRLEVLIRNVTRFSIGRPGMILSTLSPVHLLLLLAGLLRCLGIVFLLLFLILRWFFVRQLVLILLHLLFVLVGRRLLLWPCLILTARFRFWLFLTRFGVILRVDRGNAQ